MTSDQGRRTTGRGFAQSGLIWALAGGLFVALGTDFACMLMAYGMGLALQDGRAGRRQAFLVSCLASVLVCVLAGPSQIPYALVGCLVAWALSADGAPEEISTGKKCLVVLGAAVALAAIDATNAYLSGTNLPAVMAKDIDAYAKAATQGAGASAATQIASLKATISMYWPMTFMASAMVEAICSRIGAVLAAGKRGVRTKRTLSDFDAPLWVCVAFAIGAIVSYLSSRVPAWSAWSSQIHMAGENILTASRIALTLQGMAVMTWFLKRAHVGPFLRGMLLVVAFYLEVSYIVMSVVGLVDIVVANFRGVPRRRGRSAGAPTQ